MIAPKPSGDGSGDKDHPQGVDRQEIGTSTPKPQRLPARPIGLSSKESNSPLANDTDSVVARSDSNGPDSGSPRRRVPQSSGNASQLTEEARGSADNFGHSSGIYDTLEQDYSTQEEIVLPSFTCQLLASVHRMAQERWRRKARTAAELLVPVLFTIILLIITKLLDSSEREFNFLTDNASSTINVNPYAYLAYTCYNESEGFIFGLPPCSSVNYEVDCSGDETDLPVAGLCVRESLGWSGMVGLFTKYSQGDACGIYNLDSVIVHQWAALKLADNGNILPMLAAAAALGFGSSIYTRANSMISSGYLYFAPASNVPQSLIDYMNETSTLFRYIYGGVFDSTEDAVNHVKRGDQRNWGIIEVNDIVNGFDVQLRLNGTALPAENPVNLDFSGSYYYDSADMYVVSGFLAIQKVLLDYYVHGEQGLSSVLPVVVSTPNPKVERKVFLNLAAPPIGFILVLSFLYPFCHMVERIVLDKELHIREAMLIMGLRVSPMYLSFAIVQFLEGTLTILLMTIVLRLGVTTSSDPFTILVIFLVFLLSLIGLAGLVSTLFSDARFASQTAPLLFFVMSFPVFALGVSPTWVTIVLSFMSPTALAAVLADVLTLESGSGFYFGSFTNQYFSPRPWVYMAIMSADFVIYTLLMLYADMCITTSWGFRRHPLFFVIEPYRSIRDSLCGSDSQSVQSPQSNRRSDQSTYSSNLKEEKAVEMIDLVKEYSSSAGTFNAVNHLTWSLNRNEISVVLGPNGAGKSTTVNIITGMTKPSSGDCLVNGYSVLHSLDKVRQVLGFCPQHNILWPSLTCREHLEFYGKIKGIRGAQLENAVMEMLQMVDLEEKADYLSGDLSGGQKRKLSVAIAFVGNNSVVILDEPTAGMDASARRHTWGLLRLMSKRCTIILTTHFMDEADLLGDSIGVISAGELQCSGSSLVLRSRLGTGYTLRVELKNDTCSGTVENALKSAVPACSMISHNGREALFGLPKESIDAMPSLLQLLEKRGDRVGARGFSVSASTLEEVFLRVVSGKCSKKTPPSLTGDMVPMNTLPQDSNSATDVNALCPAATEKRTLKIVWNASTEPSTTKRWWMQLTGTLYKRLQCARRDRKLIFFQILCPVACILFALALQRVHMSSTSTLVISSAMFKADVTTILSRCSPTMGSGASLLAAVGSSQPYVHLQQFAFWGAIPLSEYLLDTCYYHDEPRYTSIQCISPEYMELLNNQMDQVTSMLGNSPAILLIKAQMEKLSGVSTMLYNTSSSHSVAIALQQYYHYLMLGHGSPLADKPFKLSRKAMPATKNQNDAEQSAKSTIMGIIIVIPFTLFPSTVIAWIVKERECKAKHMQRLSGLFKSAYWIGNFIFDFLSYAVMVMLVIVLFLIFREKSFVGHSTMGLMVTALLCYGVSSILSAYAFGFLFDEHTSAQQTTMVINFSIGLIFTLAIFVLSSDSSTQLFAERVRWIVRLFPSFCMGEILMNLSMLSPQLENGLVSTVWTMEVAGWPCIYMSLEVPALAIVIFIMEHPQLEKWIRNCRLAGRFVVRLLTCGHFCQQEQEELPELGGVSADSQNGNNNSSASPLGRHRRTESLNRSSGFNTPGAASSSMVSMSATDASDRRRGRRHHQRTSSVQALGPLGEIARLKGEDSDVEDERAAVYHDERTHARNDVLRVVDLQKEYSNGKVAVKSLTFGVMPGEVFAFLGTNGAGKTTSLSIVCQEQVATRGEAYVDGHSTISDSAAAMSSIGYCPQFDATLSLLSAEEHLYLFANIRGIAKNEQKEVVECLLEVCGITPFRNTLAGDMSGGNRRKLSVAISLIGAPRVVCMDEPSAGMDPLARRQLWDAMKSISGYCAIVLTTHHLEEVEALADYISIMSRGVLRCVGDLAHLKSKYGSGYELAVRVDAQVATKRQMECAGDDVVLNRRRINLNCPFMLKDPILRFIGEHFPGTILTECFEKERYVFALPQRHTVLSRVFSLLQKHKEELSITDYCVSQTSIEQVFIGFCAEEEGVLKSRTVEKEREVPSHSPMQSMEATRHMHTRSASYSFIALTPSGATTANRINNSRSGRLFAADGWRNRISGKRRKYNDW